MTKIIPLAITNLVIPKTAVKRELWFRIISLNFGGKIEILAGKFEILAGKFEILAGKFEILAGKFEILAGKLVCNKFESNSNAPLYFHQV